MGVPIKRLSFTLFSLFAFPLSLIAQDQADAITSTTQVESKEYLSTLSLNGGFSSIGTDVSSATGMEVGITYTYAVTDDVGLVADFHQGLNTSGFGTLYSEIGGGMTYAISGSLAKRTRNIKINSESVSEAKVFANGAFLLSAQVKQYFFNGQESVIPLVGPGLSLFYRFPSQKKLSIQLGGGYDFGQNGDRTLTALKIYLSAGFWL